MEIGHRFDLGAQVGLQAHHVQEADALHTLDEYNQVAVRHLDGLVQLGHGAHAVQIGVNRVLDARVELRDHCQEAWLAFQRIQQRQ